MGGITVLASIEDRVKQAGILYSSGLSTREVAAALGISKSTGSLYVKQSGVAMDGPARISKKMTGRIGARKGATHTEEAKQKMSIARKGKSRHSAQSARQSKEKKCGLRRLSGPQDPEKPSGAGRQCLMRLIQDDLIHKNAMPALKQDKRARECFAVF